MGQSSAPTSGAEGDDESRLVGSDRVLAVLAELGRHPSGIGLDELSRNVRSPKPTVHRALMSLRKAGFAHQDGYGRYELGDELVRMAFAYHEARPDHLRVQPVLEELCGLFGETVHYAVLDGRSVVYRSKVDPQSGAVRLTSMVGGRNPAHSTAVGKVLLAHQLADDVAVRAWVSEGDLARATDRTKTTADDLCADLAAVRSRGYAVEDQENEPGISCVALPVFLGSPTVPSGAISISSLVYRTPLQLLLDELDTIRAIVSPPAVGATGERQTGPTSR